VRRYTFGINKEWRSFMMRFIYTLIVSSALLSAAASANAGDKTEADKHYRAGMKLMKAANFASAATELEQSALILANKKTLFDLAACYRTLGRDTDALPLLLRLQNEFGAELGKAMRNDVDAEVARMRGVTAHLTVSVGPDGASVKVDGKNVGVSPLPEPLLVKSGEHYVEASLDKYETAGSSIDLPGGSDKMVLITLEEVKAHLSVSSNEQGAEIFVDEEVAGKTPLAGPIDLKKGTHTVRATKQGFVPSEQIVSLEPGGTGTLWLTLAPAPTPVIVPPPVLETTPILPPPSIATSTERRPEVRRKRRGGSLLSLGAIGTAAAAGVAGGMWGAVFVKRDDYIEKNNELRADLANFQWDTDLAAERDDDLSKGKVFNVVAIAAGAAAGVFFSMMVSGAILMGSEGRARRTSIAVEPSGMEVRF
jgi:hypothetical protein